MRPGRLFFVKPWSARVRVARRLAELMYYGGTAIDIALAVTVMTQWYLAIGRALARTRRRSAVTGP